MPNLCATQGLTPNTLRLNSPPSYPGHEEGHHSTNHIPQEIMIKGYRTQSIVFGLLSRLFIQSIGVLRRQLLTVVNEHIKKNNKKNISNVTLHY